MDHVDIRRFLRDVAIGCHEIGVRECNLLLALDAVGRRAAFEVDRAVGDQRNSLHLGRKLARDVADDVAVDPGYHQRDGAQAVFVEEPEPDVGDVFEVLADFEFEFALDLLLDGFERLLQRESATA